LSLATSLILIPTLNFYSHYLQILLHWFWAYDLTLNWPGTDVSLMGTDVSGLTLGD